MATSVKMDEETKSELEELQAEIRLKTGQQVTQQELLARLVDQAVASKADLIDSFRDEFTPLDADERAAFNDGKISSGKPLDEEDIDEELYG
ncbi:hypothetical protein [Natronomonas sp. EA1]|uniref:hypothetical protein n=1 Tax=Natronomonas sp. EA1 TaxID=3421655 RepID=UPI003EB96155